MPPSNDWTIGVQWDPHWNKIAWSQAAPFAPVYPQQVKANSNLFTTEPFTELTGVYLFGCGHSVDQCMLQLDYDYVNAVQVMLVLCPTCTYVSRVISPASVAYNPVTNAIITP